MLEIWPPRKSRATIATMAMRARISAYSARPWPSSSRRNEAIRAVSNDMEFHLLSSSVPLCRSRVARLGLREAHVNASRTLQAVPGAMRWGLCAETTSGEPRPDRAAARPAGRGLDRLADRVEDAGDLAAQEE